MYYSMAALSNPRQERFARLVVKGIPPYRAYPDAGYRFDAGNPYRLTENDRVKRRVSELQKAAQMRTINTVESIADELDEAKDIAKHVEQPSAMVAASVAKAKLLGLMVDKSEVKHIDLANADEDQIRQFITSMGLDPDKVIAMLLDAALSNAGAELPGPNAPSTDAAN